MPPDPTTSTSTTTSTSSSTSTSTTSSSTSTSTSTSTSSSTSTTTTLAHLSGTVADKNGLAIVGAQARVSVYSLDASHQPTGSLLASALSSAADGSWAIASAALSVGSSYIVLFSLHETYIGDQNIAGAEFQTAT